MIKAGEYEKEILKFVFRDRDKNMSEKTFAELLERHISVKMLYEATAGGPRFLVVNETTPDGYKVNENGNG